MNNYFIYDSEGNVIAKTEAASSLDATQKLYDKFGDDAMSYDIEESDAWSDVPNLDDYCNNAAQVSEKTRKTIEWIRTNHPGCILEDTIEDFHARCPDYVCDELSVYLDGPETASVDWFDENTDFESTWLDDGIEVKGKMNNLTVKFIEDDGRKWYTLNGYCIDTEVDFENETFGVNSDGTILDADGCPLTSGDSQTIAVENAIERFNREQEKKSASRKDQA